jgi:hypothetical protein
MSGRRHLHDRHLLPGIISAAMVSVNSAIAVSVTPMQPAARHAPLITPNGMIAAHPPPGLTTCTG